MPPFLILKKQLDMTKFLLVLFLFFCNLAFGQTQKISVEDAQKDIDTLFIQFERIHYNPYFQHSKSSIQEARYKLTKNWISDSIEFSHFMEVGMKLTALMSGGHSYLDWQNKKILPDLANYKFIPFTGKLNSTGAFLKVTKSNSNKIKVNETISKINGASIDRIYNDCMKYFGGLEGFKMEATSTYLPIMLFFNQSISAPYSIEFTSGRKITSEGISLNEVSEMLQQNISTNSYEFEIINDDIGLIKYNQCINLKEFKKFLKTTFKELKTLKIEKLVVDIRQNSGGNSDLNDELLSYLTTESYRQLSKRFWKVSDASQKAYNSKLHKKVFGKRFIKDYMKKSTDTIFASKEFDLIHPKKKKLFFKGKHCFLIGPGTFSSANFLADAIKTYSLSTLIGTPTGEATNDFGEQISFQLPNSNCYIFVSSTFDIGANGNHSVIEPVKPDILVEQEVLKKTIEWLNQ